jgi:hypothetical protein
MGLLRLINAQRLAPMEELLAELRGGVAAGAAGSGGIRGSAFASPALKATQMPAVRSFAPSPQTDVVATRAEFIAPLQPQRPVVTPSFASPAAAAPAGAEIKTAATMESVVTAPLEAEMTQGAGEALPEAESPYPGSQAAEHADSVEAAACEPESATENTTAARADGITPEQVEEIKAAIQAQQKFLGEIVGQGSRWELEGAELRIYFSQDKRAFAEMMEGRDSIDKVRASSSKVLGRPVRVCAKVEAVASAVPRGTSSTQELRVQFEKDPMVRSMMQRFGGKISEVKWRQEGS